MTNNWVLRGLVLAAGMLVLRLIQGVLINTFEMHAMLINLVLLAIFIAGVATWAYFDGRENAKSDPDPDRRADLAMTWLLAGLVTGGLSGAAAWLIALFDTAIYTGGLINELTTFASFTALLVFVPAVAAVALGRWQIDRNPPPPRPAADDERADTDVFAAVDGDVLATSAAVSGAPTAVLEAAEPTTAVIPTTTADDAATAITPPPDLTPTAPKKRWWHRTKPAGAATIAAAAYTMDETQPVSHDVEQTTATPADSAAAEEPTSENSSSATDDES